MFFISSVYYINRVPWNPYKFSLWIRSDLFYLYHRLLSQRPLFSSTTVSSLFSLDSSRGSDPYPPISSLWSRTSVILYTFLFSRSYTLLLPRRFSTFSFGTMTPRMYSFVLCLFSYWYMTCKVNISFCVSAVIVVEIFILSCITVKRELSLSILYGLKMCNLLKIDKRKTPFDLLWRHILIL